MHRLILSAPYKRTKFKFSVLLNIIEETMNFYAVAKGRNPGIYSTWDECKAQVHKFPGPVYKKFNSKSAAENFIKENSGASKVSETKKSLFFSNQKKYVQSKNNSQISNTAIKRLLGTSSDSENEESQNVDFKRKKLEKSNECNNSQNKSGFTVDENGFTEVFTDGACSANGRGNAKAGIGIWFYDNCSLNVSQPVIGRATNNMAEIQAVTIAAKQAQKAGIKKLKISTDSKFLISCITQWMPKWKRCGWLTANGKPVINKVELIEMEKALAPLQVTWNHVRGHVGIYGNEKADELARNGSERYRQK